MQNYILLVCIIIKTCETFGDDDPEIKISKKGSKTEMNCTTTEEIGSCEIFHNEKSCTSYVIKDKFAKLSKCDEEFDGVIFNRMDAGKTCQIVIENTKPEHNGIWICSVLHKHKSTDIIPSDSLITMGKI